MSHSIQPTALQLAYLSTLQSSRHLYAGTVPEHVIAKRRAKNRMARKSRRINRQH